MPPFRFAQAPLPNRVEGERPPQMVARGTPRLKATTWMDRIRDVLAPMQGDPASDVMGVAGPMQIPGALGIGIAKTGLPRTVKKVGEWGAGPANEALDYLAAKFPRLAQQAEFVMDEALPRQTSARWSPDNYLPHRATGIAAGGERNAGPVGSIKLNRNIHGMRFGGNAADETVNSVSHEMQHMADNLRSPQKYVAAIKLGSSQPFGYELNPYENLANITGAMEQGRFATTKGRRDMSFLDTWASDLRNRFPEQVKDVFAPFIPPTSANPMEVMKALRKPNRVLANMMESLTPNRGEFGMDSARQLQEMDQMLRSPDALRRAILALKGR